MYNTIYMKYNTSSTVLLMKIYQRAFVANIRNLTTICNSENHSAFCTADLQMGFLKDLRTTLAKCLS